MSMTLIPAEIPVRGGWHDRVRRAIGRYVPIGPHGTFARHVAGLPLAGLTDAQWAQVMRLAWRYRKRLPAGVVPPAELVKLLPISRPERARAKPIAAEAEAEAVAPAPKRPRGRPRQVAPAGQADLETWLAERHPETADWLRSRRI